jgi:hypothetical protein
MKYRDHIIFLGLSLVVISLLYFFTTREGFASINPLPTLDDWKSMKGTNVDGSLIGTPSPTMQKVISFIKNYKWNKPLQPNQENNIAISLIMFAELGLTSYDDFTKTINGYVNKPTFEQVVKDVNNLLKTPFPDSVITTVTTNPQTSNDFWTEVFYASYKYIFGDEPSSAPSSSSKQQPLTMYIPQPCSASFKSIPGGAVDIQCFN